MIVLIYILLLIANMSTFERRVLVDFFRKGGFKNAFSVSGYQNKKVGQSILDVLVAPFRFDKHKYAKITEGVLFNMYAFHDEYFERQRLLSSKLFWHEYFTTHKIKTPTLYAVTKPFKMLKKPYPNREYIAKPIHGLQGSGIQTIKGSEVGPTDEPHLIQEKIQACGYKGAESFRIVTLYDGSLLVVKKFNNNNKTISNISAGGTQVICGDDMCGKFTQLRDMVDELRAAHERDFNFCFCLGWDVLVDCEDAYAIEGNWPPGLFDDSDIEAEMYYDIMLEKYKRMIIR